MSPETNRRINSPEHGANSPTNRYVETQRRKRKRGDGLLVPFRGAAPPFGARCRRCRRDRRRRIFRPALPDRRGAFRPQERRFPDQPAAAGDRTRPRRALRLDQRFDRTFAERQSRSVRRLEPRFPGYQYRHGGAVQPAHENLVRDGSRAGHALRPLGVLAFREARAHTARNRRHAPLRILDLGLLLHGPALRLFRHRAALGQLLHQLRSQRFDREHDRRQSVPFDRHRRIAGLGAGVPAAAAGLLPDPYGAGLVVVSETLPPARFRRPAGDRRDHHAARHFQPDSGYHTSLLALRT